jgi:type II secretory pathway component GspD/PulD (secretin)
MDATPRQVLIEATIAEITDSVAEQIGIRWDVDASFRGAARLTKLPFKGSYVTMDEDAKAWTYGFISFQDFFVQLQFMEQDGKAKILATPRITVLDRKPANFQVVSHIVIATKVTRQEGSLELVTQEPMDADVGVPLTVVPRIHPDNSVTLEVAPSVSTAAKSRFFSEAVDTFNRSATTTVMAQDGETIAIGGLLRNDATETIHKVPYISNIPILGYLFTHRDISNQKTELVVFLTPHLLDKEKVRKDVESGKRILSSAGTPAPTPGAK